MAQEIEDSVETTDSAAVESASDTTASADSAEAQVDSSADAGTAEGSTDEVASEVVAETSADEASVESGADAPAEERSSRPSSGGQPELSDALTSAGGEQDGPLKEVENGRAYEIIYIARIGDDTRNAAIVDRVRELIDGKGGAIDNVRSTEPRRLSYPIAKENDGIYYVINARFAAEHMSEVDRFFKLEENVIRHMVLREDV